MELLFLSQMFLFVTQFSPLSVIHNCVQCSNSFLLLLHMFFLYFYFIMYSLLGKLCISRCVRGLSYLFSCKQQQNSPSKQVLFSVFDNLQVVPVSLLGPECLEPDERLPAESNTGLAGLGASFFPLCGMCSPMTPTIQVALGQWLCLLPSLPVCGA